MAEMMAGDILSSFILLTKWNFFTETFLLFLKFPMVLLACYLLICINTLLDYFVSIVFTVIPIKNTGVTADNRKGMAGK